MTLKFTKDAASESRSSSESEVVFPSFYVPKAIEIWPGAAEAPESLRRFWPEAARKRTAGPLFLARRSTWRIALVEFGNSIRIAWVVSFWTCFTDAHSSVNARGATCSSEELQVAPSFLLIGPMPDSWEVLLQIAPTFPRKFWIQELEFELEFPDPAVRCLAA